MIARGFMSAPALRTGFTSSRAVLSRLQTAGFGREAVSFRGMSESTDNKSASSGFVPRYRVQPFDRFVLIMTRTMKPGAIPDEISYDLLEKAQSRRRIMMNMSLMFFTALGSIYAIYRGRKARDSGEDTVLETNLKKYEQYNERARVSKKQQPTE